MTSAFLAMGFFFLVKVGLRTRLKPSLTKLELAKDQDTATAVLRKWRTGGIWGWAVATLVTDLFFFMPVYVWLAFELTVGLSGAKEANEISNTLFVVFGLTVVAAFGNAVQDGLELLGIVTGKARAVFISRPLAWARLGVLVTWVVVILLWAMRWMREQQTHAPLHPGYVLTALIVATLVVALLFAKKATELSRSKPSLLSFLLVPNRIAAKDILERWGTNGRKIAWDALLLDALLALLYGLTVATFCSMIDAKTSNADVADGARLAEKGIILAAALHVAQNIGALLAVKRQVAGWWINSMRRVGWARLTIIGLVACYFVLLLVRIEWNLGVELAKALRVYITDSISRT